MEIKEKQRYILFKLITEGKIEEKSLIRALWKTLFHLFGDYGASRTGLWLIEYELNKYGIIRTNIPSVPLIKKALAMIRKINGQDCILMVLGVSGTIKSLKKKHLMKVDMREGEINNSSGDVQ
ncbi:MAG: Rpp14/Pop5 family protein [Candidatus Helarchaeota archaeon]